MVLGFKYMEQHEREYNPRQLHFEWRRNRYHDLAFDALFRTFTSVLPTLGDPELIAIDDPTTILPFSPPILVGFA